jgi:formyltetrahydrofolate-dependent phosphoribosylglycinamide formyltransferase
MIYTIVFINCKPEPYSIAQQMFDRLQHKWKVSGTRLALILCTFAIGGSLTGYAGRKLMNLFPISQNGWWIVVYIIVVTLIWPLAVLLVSIPFGQYSFFANYLKKMGSRMGIGKKNADSKPQGAQSPAKVQSIRIAIFASGTGSNAQRIIDHFRYSKSARVVLILCNKPRAGVIAIAEKEHIPVILLDKEKFFRGDGYVSELKNKEIDLLILAGFLWKIPDSLVRAYPSRIINIHPALLPKYGGKGMYGQFVHEAVLAHHEKESGITIHFVDGHYDNGDIIFQATCPVLESDTPASLAQRIHKLEHEHFPRVIEELIKKTTGIK